MTVQKVLRFQKVFSQPNSSEKLIYSGLSLSQRIRVERGVGYAAFRLHWVMLFFYIAHITYINLAVFTEFGIYYYLGPR
jgi:hypothetical protein